MDKAANNRLIDARVNGVLKKLKAVLDSINDFYIFFAPDLQVLSFNQAASNLSFNVHGKHLDVGASFLDFDNQEKGFKGFGDYFKKAINGETIRVEQLIRLDQEGNERWLELILKPINDANFGLIGVSFIANDIHERKLAEQKLMHAEIKYRALLENNHDAIVIVNSEGKLTYASPGIEIVLGYQPEEVIGLAGQEFYHPDDLGLFLECISESFKKPGIPIFYPSRLRHKKGHFIFAEGTVTNLINVEGVNGIVGNFRNVTESKIAMDMLEQQNKELSKIAWIQSHKMRAPVATILGLINLFNHKNLADPINEEVISKILVTVASLDQTVKEVVGIAITTDYSQMGKGVPDQLAD